MKNKILLTFAAAAAFSFPGAAQGQVRLVEFQTSANAAVRKPTVQTARPTGTAAPLKGEALVAAVKSGKKKTGVASLTYTAPPTDYLLLTAMQPFVANKGGLSFYGPAAFSTANAIKYINFGDPASGGTLDINLNFPSATETYVVDIPVDIIYPSTSVVILGSEGGAKLHFDAMGQQHLVFLVSGKKNATINLWPSNWITFYSCKVSLLK